MLKIAIRGYSAVEQEELQARMVEIVVNRRGWILEEKPLLLDAYHVRFEVGLANIIELYGALQQVGIQFTPAAHRALTEMCLCQKHLTEDREVNIVTVDMHVDIREGEQVGILNLVRLDPVH